MQVGIEQNIFTGELFAILEEAFETHHGIFLDQNTSLFDTLETISAEQASVPVGGKCATLAAQTAHVTFYLEVLERYIVNHDAGQVDWGEVWRTVGAVTSQEWERLKANLRHTYRRVFDLLRGLQTWDADAVGGAMAIVVHTAYHLGEIRQALCTLQ